ncbi:OmpA family protein [Devosia sp.]|uniref:OmpA family protein n=1 Tax=Devosia sp. TaxID=1871048 RepID=UPI002AFFF99A|nr:OmpA family protein [Devosia sp.]
MTRDLWKWVVPGLVTVLGGTSLSLAMTTSTIVEDLQARSAATIAAGNVDWAELSLDGRDLTLSGITTDQALVDDALSYLSQIDGLRSVTTNVALAPLASPYRLKAGIAGGSISLAGAVPDLPTRRRLLDLAGLADAPLELRSGVSARQAWAAGAEFAVAQLRYLERGEVVVSDDTIAISGLARSEQAFRDLLVVLRAGPPQGMEMGEVAITPAQVSPYRWTATSDGRRIAISGYVPDAELAERLRTADVSGLPVATGLALGSGQPADFTELAPLLLEQLARLEYGEASILDGASTLTGAPATLEIAQSVARTLQTAGSIVVLEPPRIEDYWLSVVRENTGVLIFDGYAPDDATRQAFGALAGADIAELKLGRGAPDRYRSGADFGIEALGLMREGRMALRGNALTLAGIASSSEAYRELLALIAGQAPQGISLAAADIQAPRAETYRWSARKTEAGLVLSGLVPDPQAESALREAAPALQSTLDYASGAPAGFMVSARTALALLEHLQSGEAVFDGTNWVLSGLAVSPAGRDALEAQLAEQDKAADWTLDVVDPKPALPKKSPYLWSARRVADGMVLDGYVPNAGMQRFLALHAGEGAIDETELALGAPEGFAMAVTAALDAAMALADGEARFDGVVWSLAGEAESIAARDAMLAVLAAKVPVEHWSIAVTAPEPQPEPAAEPMAPYLWSALKDDTGRITLAGQMPAQSMQRLLAVRFGPDLRDETQIVPGAPQGFVNDALVALAALAGLQNGEAHFDGTHWAISGKAGAGADIAAALAKAETPLAGWTLTIEPPDAPASAEPEAEVAPPEVLATPVAEAAETEQPRPEPPVDVAADPDYAFAARRDADGAVILSGQIPAEAALSYFAALSQGDTAAVSVADGAPSSFLPSAETGLRALMYLSEGRLDFSAGKWSLAGTAPNAGARAAVLAAIAGDPGGTRWITAIDLPPPGAEPIALLASRPAQPADISGCAAQVAEISARNSILFQSGAAIITATSEPALDELAADLAACADAVVHVEGHTDSDGDAGLNLALSVARAEAVIAALVERGIAPARLYAVGYGESAPVADNGTAEGKRLNRRIVVVVRPEHY